MGILAAPLTSDLLQQYNLPSGTQGVLVGPVTPNSPADQAGVQPGDIITALNGHNVTSPQDLRNQLDQVRPGESATVTILRSGQTLQLTLHFSQSQQSPTAVPAPSNTPAPSPNGTQLIPNTDLQLLESFVGIQAGVINSNSSAQAFNLPANTRGIYINKITPGSPASQTVLQSGDVITGMNGQDILTQVGVAQLIRAIISGRQITLDVLRNGSTLQIPINAGSALAPTSTPSTLALNLQALESFIGVQAQIVNSSAAAQSFNLPANTRGIYISNILPGSIASQTTLQFGDVITGMNGQNVSTSLDLAQLTQNILSGQQVTLDVLRNGSTAQIPLNLGF
jgi:S1-C subfamily serine protease